MSTIKTVKRSRRSEEVSDSPGWRVLSGKDPCLKIWISFDECEEANFLREAEYCGR